VCCVCVWPEGHLETSKAKAKLVNTASEYISLVTEKPRKGAVVVFIAHLDISQLSSCVVKIFQKEKTDK